jgi:ADP-ribosylation factor-binding protein GGA
MKVKLQSASRTDLPPFNPILPPTAITQIILIANPNRVVIFKYLRLNII